ncbi:MAG: DNA/RNA non-specific endonuclease [Sphingobacteriales bacterium]|nr:DNA/RNA non-specific endonuclease [Sphingobacteriales bacterium]
MQAINHPHSTQISTFKIIHSLKKHFLFIWTCGLFLLLGSTTSAQTQQLDQQIKAVQINADSLKEQQQRYAAIIEDLKLQRLRFNLEQIGLPDPKTTDVLVKHAAMIINYDEQHEQARWVAHIITPDIIYGTNGRTNDFRPDKGVKTFSADSIDYWNSGYDRGHLAPSADFRWSYKALSESYYYSNMSPQKPELNRERWSDLESYIRQYVIANNRQVYVVTGPLLEKDLPTIGKNEVSVPKQYYKVILDNDDPTGKHAIAFLMPNAKCEYPVMSYATTIDSIELLTGIDFFPALADTTEQRLEKTKDLTQWQTASDKGEALPIYPPSLPPGCFNTVQAAMKANTGKKAMICGQVVSTYKSKNGHVFINLDRKFPNSVFAVTIWSKNQANFSYQPEKYLMGKTVCVKGIVTTDNRGVAQISAEKEEQIILYDPEGDDEKSY